MMSRCRGSKGIRLAGSTVVFAGLMAACTVTVGPAVPGSQGPLIITFRLGGTGIFSISAGVPASNQAIISGLQTPSKTPDAAVLRLEPSDITVTPLPAGQDVGTGDPVSGSVTVSFRLGASNTSNPCAAGVDLGSVSGTVADGQVALTQSTLTLPSAAVGFAATGAFTLCITVAGDFPGVVVISNLTIEFNPVGDDSSTGNDNTFAPPDDNTNDNGGDVNGNDNADDAVNDNVDDGTTDDDPNDDPANGNDNVSNDDDPNDDVPVDDGTGSRLTYLNLTNDQDQNPDSGFDTRNSYANMSDSGGVIAYLSDVDTTGEGGQTPNDEVVVLVGSTKVQVSQTTEVTNGAGNTYDVSNWGPVVSADGAVVVFGSDGDLVNAGPTATDQTYLYEVATGQLRQLSSLDTPSAGIQRDWVGYPRVGGDAVAWIENDTECPTFGCGQQQRLRVTDRFGSDLLTVVFDGDLFFDDYALSGDGETIVFVSNRDPVGLNGGGYTQLFTMGVGGGSVSQKSSLTTSAAGWTPRYQRPAISPTGDRFAVWTNDPAITTSAEPVLALLDSSGGLIRVLARAGVDFSSGEDDTGRPRFSADGAYLVFATSWTFGYTQRNFRAATDGSELLEIGIGYKSIGPSTTSDGAEVVIVGTGSQFFPDQTPQNDDWTDEVWLVTIAP